MTFSHNLGQLQTFMVTFEVGWQFPIGPDRVNQCVSYATKPVPHVR